MRHTTVYMEWLDQIKDCLFEDQGNWYPGWALAKIDLPYARWTHTIYLVRDFSGIAYWKFSVKFRDQNNNHSFFDRYSHLDWTKIYHFEPLRP